MRELREERDAVMASVRQRDAALQVGSALRLVAMQNIRSRRGQISSSAHHPDVQEVY